MALICTSKQEKKVRSDTPSGTPYPVPPVPSTGLGSHIFICLYELKAQELYQSDRYYALGADKGSRHLPATRRFATKDALALLIPKRPSDRSKRAGNMPDRGY